MSDEATIALNGSYEQADFLAALGLAPQPAHMDDAAQPLIALTNPTVLIWHNFHGAKVGEKSSAAMADWLRAVAHRSPQLRLVF